MDQPPPETITWDRQHYMYRRAIRAMFCYKPHSQDATFSRGAVNGIAIMLWCHAHDGVPPNSDIDAKLLAAAIETDTAEELMRGAREAGLGGLVDIVEEAFPHTPVEVNHDPADYHY